MSVGGVGGVGGTKIDVDQVGKSDEIKDQVTQEYQTSLESQPFS